MLNGTGGSHALLSHPRFPVLKASKDDLQDLTTPIAGGILLDYLGKTHSGVSCAMNTDRDSWVLHCEGGIYRGKYLGEACAKALLQVWTKPTPVDWSLKPLGV